MSAHDPVGPATPASPATPATPAAPATPATLATPATPASTTAPPTGWPTPRWEAARRFRDALASADLTSVPTSLSPQGLRAIVDASVAALSDRALDAVAGRLAAPPPGSHGLRRVPHRRLGIITARTSLTAALEWVVVGGGLGQAVHWKVPADDPGLGPLAQILARDAGLDLTVDTARDLPPTDVLAVLGSDATVRAVRAEAPPWTRVLAHGHAVSMAWVTADPDHPGWARAWQAVADDAALHDTRGCLSPAVALTPHLLDRAVPALADAMAVAQRRLPIGRVSEVEAARLRHRGLAARALGQLAEGAGWSVHGLPLAAVEPTPLPRSVMVAQIATPDDVAPLLRGLSPRALSAVGTDDPSSAEAWLALGATRVAPLGTLQRPPLLRAHDGEDWIDGLLRVVSVEG